MMKMLAEKTFPILKELLINEKNPLQASIDSQQKERNNHHLSQTDVVSILRRFIMKKDTTSTILEKMILQEKRQDRIQILLGGWFFKCVMDVLTKVGEGKMEKNEKELFQLCFKFFLDTIQQGSSSQVPQLLKNHKILDESSKIVEKTFKSATLALEKDALFAELFPSWLLALKSNKEHEIKMDPLSSFEWFQLADVSQKILQAALPYLTQIKSLDEADILTLKVHEFEKMKNKLKLILETKEMRKFFFQEKLDGGCLMEESHMKSFYLIF